MALFSFPVWLSFTANTDAMIGGGMFLHSVTLGLKLISFHHVMHDVRGLVRRVIKAKQDDNPITPNISEGTVLGVT